MRARRTGIAAPCGLHREVVILTLLYIWGGASAAYAGPLGADRWAFKEKRSIRYGIMHTFVPRMGVLLRVSHPRIRRGQPTFFTFCTNVGDVESVEAPGDENEDELNFRKVAHQIQEADGVEEFSGARRVGEPAKEHANGCVHLHVDGLHRLNLNMQEMRGQSRGMRRGI